MGQFEEMKGFYLVLNNASIHTVKDINAMITERGYECIHLPSHYPEINLIKSFRLIVKNKVRHSSFKTSDDLATMIPEAYNAVPPSHLRAFVQHLTNIFKNGWRVYRY